MHFPEEQLTTYLRTFLPADRIDAVLDQIAESAIDSEVEDPVELFVLAHWLMDEDGRRTDELEAVVLVEEVGLPIEEVAVILDCDVDLVHQAVADAWAAADVAVAGLRAAEHAAAEPVMAEDVAAVDVAVEDVAVEDVSSGAEQDSPLDQTAPEAVPAKPEGGHRAAVPPSSPAAVESAGADPDDARRHRRARVGKIILTGFVVVGLGALAAVVFSEAGQQRVLALGYDPLLVFMVIVGLVVGGWALVMASSP